MSLHKAGSVCALLVLAAGRRHVSQDPFGADPFGVILPPMNMNPVVTEAHRQAQVPQAAPMGHAPSGGHVPHMPPLNVVQQEERILQSEALLDEQVELNQEERLEVQCVGMEHLREVTYYETEQREAEAEMKSIRHFKPTEAEHQCLPLHFRNKKLPGRLLSDRPSGYVNLPGFPERLGEIVIEAVHHTEKTPGKHHVVLEVVGCTACENDYEDMVEWGGLLAVDETGSYRKMYTYNKVDNYGKPHFQMGDRKNIMQTPVRQPGRQVYPRAWAFEATPHGKQKFVKQFKYKYSSFRFDEKILDEVETMAKDAVTDSNDVNAHFIHEHKKEELEILKELRSQEKHIPFNHKMEQMHMHIYICSEEGGGLRCPPTPAETLIVHDGALVFDSGKTVLFDQLGKQSAKCAYGPCLTSKGLPDDPKRPEHLAPYTMCSGCTGDRRCGHHSRTSPHRGSMPQTNWFNCMVERAYNGNEPVDMLFQNEGHGGRSSSGFLFRGEESKGHVTGHINWHLTVPRAGECEPFLQNVAYIGVGVDECDKCRNGGVDVDVGVVLLSCKPAHSKNLGSVGQCSYYHHVNYAQRQTKTNNYAMSEDSRGGEGEGDDEWIFLNLEGLQRDGVTHAIISANIFGCEDGSQPQGGIGWQNLEGAFLRVTGSGGSSKEVENAETIGYIDLDGMEGPARNGAGLVMFYLSEDSNLAVPPKMDRTDSAHGSGRNWKMVTAKKPYEGRNMNKEALASFGLSIIGNAENSIPEQVASMELPTLMATEQLPANSQINADLMPVLADGINDANNFHPAGETSQERQAKHMSEQTLWHNLAYSLPEGPPGTDVLCAPSIYDGLQQFSGGI